MKAGIVGLPNVGKSSLFNCFSNAKAQSANFPFCTIEPNIGTVNVPDSRINVLESSKAVAIQTKAVIEKFNFINQLGSGKKVFYCNGSTKTLNNILNHKFEIIKL